MASDDSIRHIVGRCVDFTSLAREVGRTASTRSRTYYGEGMREGQRQAALQAAWGEVHHLAEQPGLEKAPAACVGGRESPRAVPALAVGPHTVPVNDTEKLGEYSYETELFSKGGSSSGLWVGPAIGGRIVGHWTHHRLQRTVKLVWTLPATSGALREVVVVSRNTTRAGRQLIDIDSLLPNTKLRPSQLRKNTRGEARRLKTGPAHSQTPPSIHTPPRDILGIYRAIGPRGETRNWCEQHPLQPGASGSCRPNCGSQSVRPVLGPPQ
jgi:hypothetical protein